MLPRYSAPLVVDDGPWGLARVAARRELDLRTPSDLGKGPDTKKREV